MVTEAEFETERGWEGLENAAPGRYNLTPNAISWNESCERVQFVSNV